MANHATTGAPRRGRHWRRRAGLVLTAGAVLAGTGYVLGPLGATASSHREAPLIASFPAYDTTDVYAFVSPQRPDYVTLMANWIPFEEPNGGPNFFPFATDARYLINVDSDGDAKPDTIFRWTFTNVDNRGNSTFLYNNGPVESLDDENLLFRQTYMLESSFDGGRTFQVRVPNAPVAPSYTGPASMPNYQALRDQAIYSFPGGWKGFAGQADDPFFLDLRVFDLLYGGDLSETGQDTLAGYNVNTIALEVPFADVALGGDATRNPVIGVWATTEVQSVRMSNGQTSGQWVQVSRLGQPLVNEVVVPAGLKDAFNSLTPDKDATIQAVVDRVTNPEVPQLIEAIYGIPAPPAPRTDLVEIFLTGITTQGDGPIQADLNSQLMNTDVDRARFQPSEMLRLNLSVPVNPNPDRLGVLAGDLQGFPNGRRLTDDVVDIGIQALEGAALTGQLVDALAAGDGVDANNVAFSDTFPYVALPNGVAVNSQGPGVGGGAAGPGPSEGGPTAPATDATAEPMNLTDYSTWPTPVQIGVPTAFGAGLLGFVGWWWMRRRRQSAVPTSPSPVATPHDHDTHPTPVS